MQMHILNATPPQRDLTKFCEFCSTGSLDQLWSVMAQTRYYYYTVQDDLLSVVQACATWLVHHPYLLGDKECLATVVEVAELGVSGSKSQQKASDPPVMKVANLI